MLSKRIIPEGEDEIRGNERDEGEMKGGNE